MRQKVCLLSGILPLLILNKNPTTLRSTFQNLIWDNFMKKRILCVEDDADHYDLILSILKEYDYEVIVAVSFEDALKKAKAEKFDLYLVDYFLPDGLGLEFILTVKSFTETPSLIVTGATSLSEPQAERFGAYGLIKKNSPTFVKDLSNRVSQYFALTAYKKFL